MSPTLSPPVPLLRPFAKLEQSEFLLCCTGTPQQFKRTHPLLARRASALVSTAACAYEAHSNLVSPARAHVETATYSGAMNVVVSRMHVFWAVVVFIHNIPVRFVNQLNGLSRSHPVHMATAAVR